jgi:hypothetical protein
MTIDLRMRFGTHEGEKDYNRAIADLIRAERHDLAEDRLLSDLASLAVPLAELCLETRTDAIELDGWDTLGQMIFRPTETGGLCTAVGLDLSNHADSAPTLEGWVEPSVEVAFYSDAPFPFSTKSREEILAQNADCGTPWQGCFEGIGCGDFGLVGLARLNSAIERRRRGPGHRVRPRPGKPPAPAPAEFVAFRLAEWFRALRYHQTVKRYLDHKGLSRRIPVIVGSHGAGPFLEAVYYPAPALEAAESVVARVEAAMDTKRRAARADKKHRLQKNADFLRELRAQIRKPRFWPSSKVRRLRRFYEAHEALFAQSHPLGRPPQPSWRIADDAEYERFLTRYYVDAFLE